ncbi:MAG: type I glyceraldehyde-3-phosphate dehydrogenase [Bacteroidota bacterium]|mgnify:FL=1|nr:type I glyceraldehyde-3-phosphate dehydrogenase [Bacteroidota bacterium]
MSKLGIGINGFGRIGRMVLRATLQRTDFEIRAINDLLDVDHLVYLLKYDSVHGNVDAEIHSGSDYISVNGNKISIFSEKDPAKIDWTSVGVSTVVECTGLFTARDDAAMHLTGDVKNVIISAPSKDAPMFVMGVNHEKININDKVVSNASCTTNCLAPAVKVLHDNFEVKEALMTTVHAATATQFTVDGPSRKNYRLGRSALNNIIPTSTGAAKAVTKVIPSLEGKITGMAFRIPTANVSVVDLTVKLGTSTSYQDIMNAFEFASNNELKGILGFTNDNVVSQDFVGDPRTSIVDAGAGIELNDTFFKLIIWYDNEAGYSNKLLDMALHINNL